MWSRSRAGSGPCGRSVGAGSWTGCLRERRRVAVARRRLRWSAVRLVSVVRRPVAGLRPLVSSLNSFSARPVLLPRPASREPPNSSRTTTKMMSSSGTPRPKMASGIIIPSFRRIRAAVSAPSRWTSGHPTSLDSETGRRRRRRLGRRRSSLGAVGDLGRVGRQLDLVEQAGELLGPLQQHRRPRPAAPGSPATARRRSRPASPARPRRWPPNTIDPDHRAAYARPSAAYWSSASRAASAGGVAGPRRRHHPGVRRRAAATCPRSHAGSVTRKVTPRPPVGARRDLLGRVVLGDPGGLRVQLQRHRRRVGQRVEPAAGQVPQLDVVGSTTSSRSPRPPRSGPAGTCAAPRPSSTTPRDSRSPRARRPAAGRPAGGWSRPGSRRRR